MKYRVNFFVNEEPVELYVEANKTLLRVLREELGFPGVILTDMVAHVDPAVLEALREETPLERNGRPEDVAKAMVYLAGAEFITGQILPVNGGFVIT